MADDVIGRDCAAKFVAVAKVRGHRLAFTRRSVAQRGGAADLVPAPGMIVWGVVYEVSEADLAVLDKKEGHPHAYARTEIVAEGRGADPPTYRCTTYTVVDKQSPEVEPRPEYMEVLRRAAEERKLPLSYRQFLASIAAQSPGTFRKGHLILPTTVTGPRSLGALQLNRREQERLGLGDLAAVEVANRRCIVQVLTDNSLDDAYCRLDQNVRDAIGAPGQHTYGATARLRPHSDRLRPTLIRPRFLVLPIGVPARLDSEKKIAVLHPKNIRLLGVNEGDYVRIRASIVNSAGKDVSRSITLRAFTGSAKDAEAGRPETERTYPRQTEIYVDAQGRRELGLRPDERDAPVVVTADVRKLFLSRALFYGLTYFVGIAGLAATTGVVVDWVRGDDSSDALVYLISAVFAALLTATLAVLDIRSRVQS